MRCLLNRNRRITDYQRFVNYLDPVPTLPPSKIIQYQHAGKLHWFRKGKIHDEIERTEVIQTPDKWNKNQVRENIATHLTHLNNHQMLAYQETLERLVPGAKSFVESMDCQQQNEESQLALIRDDSNPDSTRATASENANTYYAKGRAAFLLSE